MVAPDFSGYGLYLVALVTAVILGVIGLIALVAYLVSRQPKQRRGFEVKPITGASPVAEDERQSSPGGVEGDQSR